MRFAVAAAVAMSCYAAAGVDVFAIAAVFAVNAFAAAAAATVVSALPGLLPEPLPGLLPGILPVLVTQLLPQLLFDTFTGWYRYGQNMPVRTASTTCRKCMQVNRDVGFSTLRPFVGM